MTASADLRFEFGENWAKFLQRVDDVHIRRAEESLQILLGMERLDRLTFLDIGSGAGLSSLAARRLGATVWSFDYDPAAVACTAALREQYDPNDGSWFVGQGSVLDNEYLRTLGTFDIVYSWGVLHHTGRMWEALGNASTLVRPGGTLVVAIYNHQGRASRVWTSVKRLYNRLPRFLRFIVLWPVAIWLWGPATLRDAIFLRPFATWRNYHHSRGMSPWRDVVDWVGGYPFEVAKPEEIVDFFASGGFRLRRLTTCAGGHGCNEYVFEQEKGQLRSSLPPSREDAVT